MGNRSIPYEVLKARSLQDPEVRQAYDELELAHQIALLRIRRGLTQQELADLVGTKQPSIARLESGRTNPNYDFLKRVLDALGASLSLETQPRSVFELETGIVNVFTYARVRPAATVKSGAELTESNNVTIDALPVAV